MDFWGYPDDPSVGCSGWAGAGIAAVVYGLKCFFQYRAKGQTQYADELDADSKQMEVLCFCVFFFL